MIVTPISTICSPIYSLIIPLVMMKLEKNTHACIYRYS